MNGVTLASPPYVGNSHYCFANATAMLLASIGEQVSPGMVEALSGVGLGATWSEGLGLIFFDASPPDVGISRALGLLGFEVTESASPDGGPAPVAELTRALADGPVVLGPVDMGLLLYRGTRGQASGVDHYVLAYAIDDSEVYLHDPDRFPHVSLRIAELVAAWRAEKIGYRRGAFRSWRAPRRVDRPSDDDLFERALRTFGEVYRRADEAAARGRMTGSPAIRRLSDLVRAGALPDPLAGHLRAFALQLGARRALDFAAFFDRGAPDLAALKREQARLFGRAHTLLVRQDWPGTADALTGLAVVEDQIRALLIGAAVPV